VSYATALNAKMLVMNRRGGGEAEKGEGKEMAEKETEKEKEVEEKKSE
jgi:hypothetical protein